MDECLVQFDRQGRPIYVLQDANDNVVGLVSGGGTDAPASGTLLEQYTYEPDGSLVAAESFAPHAVNRLGHKGLFFDHFDAGPDGRVLLPGAPGLYFNRNRHYSPTLGRFMQRDPNETGLPAVESLAMDGDSWSTQPASVNARRLYGDSLNLYQYESSNPASRLDPTGLLDGILEGLWIDANDAKVAAVGLSIAAGIRPLLNALELMRAAIIDDIFDDRPFCTLKRQQRSKSIHPGRPGGPLGNYYECVYFCPGFGEYTIPGTHSALFRCPPIIPNQFR